MIPSLCQAFHNAHCRKVIDCNNCSHLHPIIQHLCSLSVCGFKIIASMICYQSWIKINVILIQNLLITLEFLKCSKDIQVSAYQCNTSVPQLQQMIHQQLHCLHTVNTYCMASGSIQFTGYDNRCLSHDLVDQLHIFFLGYQIIHSAAKLDNRIHFLLL